MTTFDFQDGNECVQAHQHPNGGGWVADTATVEETAYVGPDARVFGNAYIYGSAEVFDNTSVFDNAEVFGSARIFGNACISGNAWVSGSARIFGSAYIYGSAEVSGNVRISGNAEVYNNARVYGNVALKRGKYASNPVTIMRSDGYAFTLQSDSSIIAGCRDFTQEEAFEYWGNPKHHLHSESIAIVNALYAINKARCA